MALSLEELSATEEIKQLKARYFVALDTRNWELMRDEVVTRSTTFEFDGLNSILVGADAFIEMLSTGLEGRASVHHGHTPNIKITSETSATGLWAMEDRIYARQSNGVPGTALELHGYGHYHETYERRPEGWRIATLRLTRLWTSSDPVA